MYMKIFSVQKYQEWHKKEYGEESDLDLFYWPLDCDGQPYNAKDNSVIGKSGDRWNAGGGTSEWFEDLGVNDV